MVFMLASSVVGTQAFASSLFLMPAFEPCAILSTQQLFERFRGGLMGLSPTVLING
jgi:hypothetical protein